jgi:transcriptional regulator with XRE-family HTH domain
MSENLNYYPDEVKAAVNEIGLQLRIARKRRRMPQRELATKAGISEKTLRRLELGDAGVAFGCVLRVLWALGLLANATALANPDTDRHGKILELARLPQRIRESVPNNDF